MIKLIIMKIMKWIFIIIHLIN